MSASSIGGVANYSATFSIHEPYHNRCSLMGNCPTSSWESVLSQEPVLISVSRFSPPQVWMQQARFLPLLCRRLRSCAPTIVSHFVQWTPHTIEVCREVLSRHRHLHCLHADFICSLLKTVDFMGGVHKLHLTKCYEVSDVSALKSVHTLDLSECRGITDLSALNSVHTLDLSGCRGVTDVGALGTVHKLDLSGCHGVTDVGKLGGVHSLKAGWCSGLTDVSALGGWRAFGESAGEEPVHNLVPASFGGFSKVFCTFSGECLHTLDLRGCSRVSDVSALCGVHTLNLSCCSGVNNVRALGRVHTLNLSACGGITDVSALSSVHTLDLSDCDGVTDVSALGGVHTLYLSGCRHVRDVSALGRTTDASARHGGLHTLYLVGCSGVTDVSSLGGVHRLVLSFFDGPDEPKHFGRTLAVHGRFHAVSFNEGVTVHSS